MHKLNFKISGRYLLGGFAVALLAVILFAALDNGPNFSEWSQAVDVGPPISTDDTWEGCPFISKNGLDLYFRKELYNAEADIYHWDIFVSHRDSVDDPWEDPINLGPNINTDTSTELCSFVTIDGHWIYFVSNRTGTYGGSDLWVSHRKDKRNDTGWETPKNLGPLINSSAAETGPCIFEDEATGQAILYFTSAKGGNNDIYSSLMLDKETFGSPIPVAELNTPSNDAHAFIRRKDGLEVIFFSNYLYPGAMGLNDLYVSTRPTTSDPWSPPVNLGPNVNSKYNECRPSISWDGTTLYFWTNREIHWPPYRDMDIYQATRIKNPKE